jgi:hypothetical protein
MYQLFLLITINVRENRRDNQELEKHPHCVHKTQDNDKQKKTQNIN